MQYQRAFTSVAVASLILVSTDVDAGDLPDVPGFTVEVFAELCEPGGMSFGPAGFLFTGNGGCGHGNGDPAWVRRIPPSGAIISAYGEDEIVDPDLVLVDMHGFILEPGTVLVGSSPNIEAILPDESIVTAVDASANVSNLVFDSVGRLYFTNLNNNDVLVTTGGTAETLFTAPSSNVKLAIDDEDRIYTNSLDGKLRIWNTDGELIDPHFATVSGAGRMAFGRGGSFGNDLYVATGGSLLRIDRSGNVEVIGTNPGDGSLTFGPDGALYIAQGDWIVRIRGCPDLNGDALVDTSDLIVLLAAWGACGNCNNCPADFDMDCQVSSNDLITLLGAWGSCPK